MGVEKVIDPSGVAPGPIPEKVKQETRERLASLETFKSQNMAVIQEQLAPLRQRFLEYVEGQGLHLRYLSLQAPLAYIGGITRDQLETLARHPEIDAIYDASETGGPELDVAVRTQNGLQVRDWGSYTGTGVNVAVVEGGRVIWYNPYLTVVDTRVEFFPSSTHASHVAGIIASTDGTYRGLAEDAEIYSANGDEYATLEALEDALDWGSSNATVLNNSCGLGECDQNSNFETTDRHIDYLVRYLYDIATKSSGNDRLSGCDGAGSTYVSSPGRGYNVITVGNYSDNDSVGWSDDAMNGTSQFNIDGRYKPEVVASGTTITSLSIEDPWKGTTYSGTSMASPMVAALAANMIQADPNLEFFPESISAVIMATALHNIEGNSRLSRADGAGGINAAAALVSVERGHWGSQYVSSSTNFPLEYSVFARKGERVRFVIRWHSNPDSSYDNDPLPANLDLLAFREDGTTQIQSSTSPVNSFEIVDFVAPATETYVMRVMSYFGWPGNGTYLGRGWWRDPYRLEQRKGYTKPKAPPMGFHASVHPTDWTPNNTWRAFGIRPVDSDHDLFLYSTNLFDDPSQWYLMESSSSGYGSVDFIAVDGNHWPTGDPEEYVVLPHSGEGGYNVTFSNSLTLLDKPGFYGPFSLSDKKVLKVFDALFKHGDTTRIMIIPEDNGSDLGASLFRSEGGQAFSWYQGKGDAVLEADTSTSPDATETLTYTYYGAGSDRLGLVVYSKDVADARFYIYYDRTEVYLPIVTRR